MFKLFDPRDGRGIRRNSYARKTSTCTDTFTFHGHAVVARARATCHGAVHVSVAVDGSVPDFDVRNGLARGLASAKGRWQDAASASVTTPRDPILPPLTIAPAGCLR